MSPLDGKRALVTGGSRGIGAAIAKRLEHVAFLIRGVLVRPQEGQLGTEDQ